MLLLDIMFMGEDLMSMVIHGYDGNDGYVCMLRMLRQVRYWYHSMSEE